MKRLWKRVLPMILALAMLVGTASTLTLSSAASPTSDDAEFEASIADFPESYKTYLRELHEKYPNWVFKDVYTGTDWSDALAAESVLGMNLVYSESISSWKSTQDGAYNWSTDTWVGLDGSSWVAASEEIIAYYLDPRNYLDEDGVFTFLDYTYDAEKQTEEGLSDLVSGTFLAGTYTEDEVTYSYVSQIMSVAEETAMNPYLIATMIIQEQGTNGTGKLISGTVEGYTGLYNFFSIGAYATGTMTAVQRGLWFAAGSGTGATSYSRPWNTRYRSLLGCAQYYVANYISNNQNTIYTKKFNVIGSSSYATYTHQYMTNIQGAYSEGYTLSQAYDETARGAALVIEIPVFDNMPETAVAKPTGDGSPNNRLSALSVSGYSLTPGFSATTGAYDVVVSAGTASVTISATPVSSTATVTGTGTFTLTAEVTTFEIVVTAENGSTRTYEITVGREESEESVLDTALTVGDAYLSGLTSVPMTVSELISALGVGSSYTATVSSGGTAKTSGDNVATGDTVSVSAGSTTVLSLTVVLYGDANGDGKISSADLLKIQKHILGTASLTGAYLEAADANHDSKISSADLLKIQKQILGLSTITQ